MKRTDLEKLKGSRIVGRMHQAAVPDRFGQGSGAVVDRRERRRRDQASGLVPFAVKLDQDLVARIQGLARSNERPLGEVVAELLQAGLAARGEKPEAAG